MKTRDFVFAIILLVCVALALSSRGRDQRGGGWFGFIKKAIAAWVLIGDEQPPAKAATPSFESTPQWVLNAPPERKPGEDGFAAIDNGEGW